MLYRRHHHHHYQYTTTPTTTIIIIIIITTTIIITVIRSFINKLTKRIVKTKRIQQLNYTWMRTFEGMGQLKTTWTGMDDRVMYVSK